MERLIRPPWVELIQLQNEEDFRQYANRMFYTPDPSLFNKKLGIDIKNYKGFWAEIGGTDAPIGPVNPATDRIKIKPIIAIRMSNTGRYYVQALSSSEGLINSQMYRAWIQVDDYEKMLGDLDFFGDIRKKAEAIINRAKNG